MSRYKSQEEFEKTLRNAPSPKFIEIRNDAGTGGHDLATVPYELVREIAEIMYSEIIIVKNTCSIEPVMGLCMIEMELLATPSFPNAKPKKLFGNCMQRIVNKEGKVLEPYMIQRKAESICYRDAFKAEGNIFGRNLRGKHGADFTLGAKVSVGDEPEPDQEQEQPQPQPEQHKKPKAESPV